MASSLLVAACNSDPAGLAPIAFAPRIKMFTGTLRLGAGLTGSGIPPATHAFTSSARGDVFVTLTSAGPPETVVVGLFVGTPTTSEPCVFEFGVFATAGPSPQISGPDKMAGDLCVGVADVGNLTADITYAITVRHP